MGGKTFYDTIKPVLDDLDAEVELEPESVSIQSKEDEDENSVLIPTEVDDPDLESKCTADYSDPVLLPRVVTQNPDVSHETNRPYEAMDELSPKKMQVLILRHLGWTVKQTAQGCFVSPKTVSNWCKEHRGVFAELPSVELARDAIQGLVPQAVDVFRKGLEGADAKIAADIATKILISNRILVDRKTIEDDTDKPTGAIEAEFETIVERAQRIADERAEEADPVGSDIEGSGTD